MMTIEELIWELKKLPPETKLKIKNIDRWLKNCIDFESEPK